MLYSYIYLIENIQNHKKYIGKTTNENPEKYIEDHFKNAIKGKDYRSIKDGKYFYNAIRKYGKENFKWIILGKISSKSEEKLTEKTNEAEIVCIYHFRTFGADGENFDDIYGYNCTIGGDGIVKGKSEKKGKTLIEIRGSEEKANETKAKMSKAVKGKKLSAQTKKLQSKNKKELFKNNPEKWKEIGRKGSKTKKKQRLEKYNINEEELLTLYFSSVSIYDLTIKYKCSRGIIIRILKDNNIILLKTHKKVKRNSGFNKKVSEGILLKTRQPIIDKKEIVIALYDEGKTFQEIKEICNFQSVNSIEFVIKTYAPEIIKKWHKIRLRESQLNQRYEMFKKFNITEQNIIDLYNQKIHISDIAKNFDCGFHLIKNILKENNIFKNNVYRYDLDEKIEEIKNLRTMGFSFKEIAARLNCSSNAIKNRLKK